MDNLLSIYIFGLLVFSPVFIFFAVLSGDNAEVPRALLRCVFWPVPVAFGLCLFIRDFVRAVNG